MSCECYQIDGPFIAEDPNCPAHGVDAQRRDDKRDDLRKNLSELYKNVENIDSSSSLDDVRNNLEAIICLMGEILEL